MSKTNAVEKIPGYVAGLPFKLVTHLNPDTDALVCLWAMVRFVLPDDAEYVFAFVRAGEALPTEDAEGFNVVSMDTGGGPFDQHSMKHTRTSSCELVANHFGFANLPGFKPILDLTVRTDNVEPIAEDSIHHALSGMTYQLNGVETPKRWDMLTDIVFWMLDSWYGTAKKKAESEAKLVNNARWWKLPNNLVVANLFFTPEVRQAAFDTGVDVVIWNAHRRKRFYPGIQVHEGLALDLAPVLAALRRKEAEKRGIELSDEEVNDPQIVAKVGAWFMHGSGKFIGCGTKTHPLDADDEYTMLTPEEIFETAMDALAAIVDSAAKKD